MEKYEDIINLPHHVSSVHPKMSLENRSAQFAPFAALTGYNEAIKETARLTDKRIEIDDGLKYVLNEKILLVYEKKQEATFTFFKPDERKSGGKYIDVSGIIKKIDNINKLLILNNGIKISIEEIINIKIK